MVNERHPEGVDLGGGKTGAITYENIPLNDAKAFELIKVGDTNGVFQFESSGMQALCKKIKPDKFAEVSAITSLFRPGPLESGMVDDYAARKFGKAKVEYMFPEMEAPLKDTYGTILYQEQVLEIAKRVAGFSLGGADLLRRAMGKKIAKEMEAQRSKFVEGAVARGKPANKAGELFDLIEKFAGYGFNKSHADAYSVLTLQTAYLKANYPSEFFAALLTIEKGDTEKLSKYIQDARARGLQVLPPDVNESGMDFTIVQEGVIRFGLSAIKNVGEGAVQSILDARAGDPGAPDGRTCRFTDLFDFLKRVDLSKVNKRTVESLTQAGALDFGEADIGHHRGKYLATAEKALEWAAKLNQQKVEGQFSLFGGGGDEVKDDLPPPRWEPSTMPAQRQLLDWEKQLLGIYVSGNPLDKFLERAQRAGAVPIDSLGDKTPKSVVTIAGIVVEFREVRVKKGKRAGEAMGIVKLEDPSGTIEMVCFPDHYKEYQALLRSQNPLLMRAELEFEEDLAKLLASQVSLNGALAVEDLSQIADRAPKKVVVTLALDRIDGIVPSELLVNEIAGVLIKHHGAVPVTLTLHKPGHFETKMELGEKFAVMPGVKLQEELAGLSAIPGSIRVDAVY
jgi:DNA polymerase-3 subunit alpha